MARPFKAKILVADVTMTYLLVTISTASKECVWDSEEENDGSSQQSCGSSSRRKWTHDKARRSGANKMDADIWSSGAGLLIKRLSTSLHYMGGHTSGATMSVHPLAWLLAGDYHYPASAGQLLTVKSMTGLAEKTVRPF